MTDAQHIEHLADQAAALEDGPAKAAAFDEVVRLADSLGLEDEAFFYRLQLITAASFGGADDLVLPAFAWCLAKSDSDPRRFPVERLLWQYKWVLGSLDDAPQVPVSQCEELLDDYERRLVENGYSERTALYYRMGLLESLGDNEGAWKYWLELERMPRDRYANCNACEQEHKVSLLAKQGRYKEAVAVGRSLISGRRFCAQIPQRSYGVMQRPLMEVGDHFEADRCFTAGYPMIRSNPDYLPTVGRHLAHLVKRRRRDEALELAERHGPWLRNSWSQSARLRMLTSLWLLAEWLRREDGEQAVPLASYGVDLEGPATAAQWEAALRAELESLEDRYFERIGNHHKRELRQQELQYTLAQ